jgi:hypothetical protein
MEAVEISSVVGGLAGICAIFLAGYVGEIVRIRDEAELGVIGGAL